MTIPQSAKIIADSISETGVRLTTFEVTYPSHLQAELVANRTLSVTAADGGNIQRPMSTTRAVITATGNELEQLFLKYQDGEHHPASMRLLVQLMRANLGTAVPAQVKHGDWHLPYIDFHTVEDCCLVALEDAGDFGLDLAALDLTATAIATRLSVVRCHHARLAAPPMPSSRANYAARIRFYKALLGEYQMLLQRAPLGTAFEHQAQPDVLKAPPFNNGWENANYHGNFRGWQQNRLMFIEPPLVKYASVSTPGEKTAHG